MFEEAYSDYSVGAATILEQEQFISVGIANPNTISSLVDSNRGFRASIPHPTDSRKIFVYSGARDCPESLASAISSGKQPSSRSFPQDNTLTEVTSLSSVVSLPKCRRGFINGSFAIFGRLQSVWTAFDQWKAAKSASPLRTLGTGSIVSPKRVILGRGSNAQQASRDKMDASGWLGVDIHGQSDVMPINKEHLLKVSALYRAEINRYTDDLFNQLGTSKSSNTIDMEVDTSVADIGEEFALFKSLHSIWHLCEIMFIGGNNARGMLVEDLLVWLNKSDARPTKEEYEALAPAIDLPAPGDRPEFWPYIIRCILRGHFHAATSMLTRLTRYHVNSASAAMGSFRRAGAIGEASKMNPVVQLTKLMHSMPRSSAFHSVADFENKWKKWRTEAEYLHDETLVIAMVATGRSDASNTTGSSNETWQADNLDGFMAAFGILAGNEEVIIDNADGWMEAVVGIVTYANPTVSRNDLGVHLDAVREQIDVVDVDEEEEENEVAAAKIVFQLAIAAAMDIDVDKVIRHAACLDGWLVAHLVDLFDKVGKIDEVDGFQPLIMDIRLPSLDDQSEDEDEMEDNSAVFSKSRRGLIARKFVNSIAPRVTLRDWYVLEYGDALASHPNHNRIGLEYLALGGKSTRSRARLEARLLRVAFTSHASTADGPELRKLVGLAEKWGLDDATQELKRIAARKAISTGRLGVAVRLLAEAGNIERAEAIGDQILRLHWRARATAKSDPNHITPANPGTLALAELAPQVVAKSSFLVFLTKLKHYEDLFDLALKARAEATSLIFGNNAGMQKESNTITVFSGSEKGSKNQSSISTGEACIEAEKTALMASKAATSALAVLFSRDGKGRAPKSTWFRILSDAVPLLVAATITVQPFTRPVSLLSLQDAQRLLKCFEEVTQGHKADKWMLGYHPNASTENSAKSVEEINGIRAVLVNVLARAMMNPFK